MTPIQQKIQEWIDKNKELFNKPGAIIPLPKEFTIHQLAEYMGNTKGMPVGVRRIDVGVYQPDMNAPLGKAEFCDRVAATICGPREKEYGDALTNFRDIAAFWTLILRTPITAKQVALCMDAVKTARLIKSPDHFDSVVDKGGYAGCYSAIMLGELLEQQQLQALTEKK